MEKKWLPMKFVSWLCHLSILIIRLEVLIKEIHIHWLRERRRVPVHMHKIVFDNSARLKVNYQNVFDRETILIILFLLRLLIKHK